MGGVESKVGQNDSLVFLAKSEERTAKSEQPSKRLTHSFRGTNCPLSHARILKEHSAGECR